MCLFLPKFPKFQNKDLTLIITCIYALEIDFQNNSKIRKIFWNFGNFGRILEGFLEKENRS